MYMYVWVYTHACMQCLRSLEEGSPGLEGICRPPSVGAGGWTSDLCKCTRACNDWLNHLSKPFLFSFTLASQTNSQGEEVSQLLKENFEVLPSMQSLQPASGLHNKVNINNPSQDLLFPNATFLRDVPRFTLIFYLKSTAQISTSQCVAPTSYFLKHFNLS